MAKKWENIDLSTVKTGDIQEATFTINKYTVDTDGSVTESDEDVPIGERELEEVREEVNQQMEQALREYEETGEVESFDVEIDATVDEPAEVDVDETEPEDEEQETEEEPEEEDEEPDVPEGMDPVEVGREIAESEGITKQDYPTFAKELRERDINDQSLQSDIWNTLKQEGAIEGYDEDEQTQDDSDDQQESGEATVGVEAFNDADSVYLVADPGDEESDAAIDQFEEMLTSGDMEMVNYSTSTEAGDLLERGGLEDGKESLPAILVETDGDVTPLEVETEVEENGETETNGEFAIPPDTDLLMVQPDGGASEMAVNALHEQINSEDVIALPITSEVGEEILDPMDPDVTTPFYLEATEDGFLNHPLEKLFDKYL